MQNCSLNGIAFIQIAHSTPAPFLILILSEFTKVYYINSIQYVYHTAWYARVPKMSAFKLLLYMFLTADNTLYTQKMSKAKPGAS